MSNISIFDNTINNNTIYSTEYINVKNLHALCQSVKLKNYDLLNFPTVKKNTKKTKKTDEDEEDDEDENDDEKEVINDDKKKMVRHNINSLKKYLLLFAFSDNTQIKYTSLNYGRYVNTTKYNKGYSLTNMYVEIRNLLIHGIYDDYDVKNCHYILFYNELIKNNVKNTTHILEYINNRDKIFKNIIDNNPEAYSIEKIKFIDLDYESKKKIIKSIFTSLLNNGKISCLETYNITENTDFIFMLFNELKNNIKLIINLDENKTIKDVITKKKIIDKETYNIDGAIIANILQTLERKMLNAFISIVKTQNYDVGALIHDGLHIRKNKQVIDIDIKKWCEFINNTLYKDCNNYDDIIKLEIINKPIIIDTSFLIPDEETIIYNDYKNQIENIENIAKIKFPPVYIRIENETYNEYDDKEIISTYNNINYFYKKKKFIKYWIEDPAQRSYNKIVFNPNLETQDKNDYNTFTGYELLKHKFNNLPTTQAERLPKIKILLDFLFDISGRNKEQYKILLNYTAHVLAMPYKKVKIALIIKGMKEGMGKNTFYLLIEAIIGRKYCVSTANIDHLFGKFSNFRRDKLFVCINEANFKQNKIFAGDLKEAITESTYALELKGKDKIPNYNSFENYIIISNEYNSVEISAKNRRFYVINLDNVNYENKKTYFNNLYHIIGDTTNKPNYEILNIFYDYLKQLFIDDDIINFDFEKNINTDESKILTNIDPLKEFIEIEIIKAVIINEYIQILEITVNELFNKYIEYLKKLRYKYEELSSPTFSKKLLSQFNNFIDKVKNKYNRSYNIDINKALIFFELKREDVKHIIIKE